MPHIRDVGEKNMLTWFVSRGSNTGSNLSSLPRRSRTTWLAARNLYFSSGSPMRLGMARIARTYCCGT